MAIGHCGSNCGLSCDCSVNVSLKTRRVEAMSQWRSYQEHILGRGTFHSWPLLIIERSDFTIEGEANVA